MSEPVDNIAAFLRAWLPTVPGLKGTHPYSRHSRWDAPLPSAQTLADELIQLTEFRALRLGTWLASSDGKLVARAVGLVVPPVYRPQYELIVSALMLAAELQRRRDAQLARAVVIGALGVAAIVIAARSNRAA